jgi:hypothetical protein
MQTEGKRLQQYICRIHSQTPKPGLKVSGAQLAEGPEPGRFEETMCHQLLPLQPRLWLTDSTQDPYPSPARPSHCSLQWLPGLLASKHKTVPSKSSLAALISTIQQDMHLNLTLISFHFPGSRPLHLGTAKQAIPSFNIQE